MMNQGWPAQRSARAAAASSRRAQRLKHVETLHLTPIESQCRLCAPSFPDCEHARPSGTKCCRDSVRALADLHRKLRQPVQLRARSCPFRSPLSRISDRSCFTTSVITPDSGASFSIEGMRGTKARPARQAPDPPFKGKVGAPVAVQRITMNQTLHLAGWRRAVIVSSGATAWPPGLARQRTVIILLV